MKRVYVYTSKKSIDSVIAYVQEVLEENGMEIVEKVDKADFVISVGGDGTFFRACKFGKPVLSVRYGNVSHSCEVDIDDLQWYLEKLNNGELSVKWLPGLRIRGTDNIAVNDIVIRSSGSTTMSWKLKIFDRTVRGRGDGVIFATALGSSGYNRSVGGPVIDLRAGDKVFVINFIAPLNKLSPTVVPGEAVVDVHASGTFAVYVDGMKIGSQREFEVELVEKGCRIITYDEWLASKHLKAVYGTL